VATLNPGNVKFALGDTDLVFRSIAKIFDIFQYPIIPKLFPIDKQFKNRFKYMKNHKSHCPSTHKGDNHTSSCACKYVIGKSDVHVLNYNL
jgi:hypothetical protein